MGTYYIPRNLGGETRILYVFTVKSLISTAIGALVGFIFFFIIGIVLGQKMAGAIIMGIFALIGWAIGALKIPNIVGIPFTKNVGGESLSEIIKRYVKFKANKKIYTYVNTEINQDTKEKEDK